jgi:hypothetical protein
MAENHEWGQRRELSSVPPEEPRGRPLRVRKQRLGRSTGCALTYPILADTAHIVSAIYGLAFQMNIHTE